MEVNSLFDPTSADFYNPNFMNNKYTATWYTTNTVTATPVILPSQIENDSELKINIKKNPIKFNFNL